MTSSLGQLAKYSILVADSGNFEDIAKYKPQDSTTNPSLILKAVQSGEPYTGLVDQAVATAKEAGGNDEDMLQTALDETLVLFGCKVGRGCFRAWVAGSCWLMQGGSRFVCWWCALCMAVTAPRE